MARSRKIPIYQPLSSESLMSTPHNCILRCNCLKAKEAVAHSRDSLYVSLFVTFAILDGRMVNQHDVS